MFEFLLKFYDFLEAMYFALPRQTIGWSIITLALITFMVVCFRLIITAHRAAKSGKIREAGAPFQDARPSIQNLSTPVPKTPEVPEVINTPAPEKPMEVPAPQKPVKLIRKNPFTQSEPHFSSGGNPAHVLEKRSPVMPVEASVPKQTAPSGPDFSPNSAIASEGRRGDTSLFDSRSQISRFELKNKLKTKPLEKLEAQYKVTSDSNPSKQHDLQVSEIEKILPKEFGAYITKSEAKKAAKMESLKISKMKREFKPHKQVLQEEKKLKFFEDAMGVDHKKIRF